MAFARRLSHPLLASLYFVLTLAASNALSLSGWRDLAWPVPLMMIVGLVCYGLAYSLSRDGDKAALLSLLWITAFSTFGYLAELLLRAGALKLIGGDFGLLAVCAVMLIGPSLAILRTRRQLGAINRYLTLVTGLLVLYTGVRLYRGIDQDRSFHVFVPPPRSTGARQATVISPDIYLIILDKYTGNDLLKRHFGYDNGEFASSLRSRGFIVPAHARANYPQTQLALAAMLNLDYLQDMPGEVHLYDLIENNRLAAFLKQRHYRFVFFPTAFKFTSRNRNADLQLPEPTQVRSEFEGVWQRTTVLPEVLQIGCSVLGCHAGRLAYVVEGADLMDWRFQHLGALAEERSPKFVFAHLGVPHEPYIYRSDCSHRGASRALNVEGIVSPEADTAYLEQLTCVNRKVGDLVDGILAHSRTPPIILLQADHGHGHLGHQPVLEQVSSEHLLERMSVFAAYYLPGLSADSVSDSVTPVNAIRLVLRHYFGADLPPLPDASYWAVHLEPREFVRVTP